ncbi:hypothetical protein GETHLI_26210 [Geothrix limicola]|uniref:Uncharacterized protein n=1 Tax=Geothrix limicola TaxID=2927978 RepID=A0ABQ5QHQ1_9BACT|nr:hypothetical protein [Geothrix limicola]GLH74119.1 hypothetical protein GETHLI_26210 [Geothrix limicola]
MDVHPLQPDRPRLQATGEESPQTRLNGDPVDPEERHPIPGRIEHDGAHHEPERSIDADRSLEASARNPGCEPGDGAFVEGPPDRCRLEQREDAKVKEDTQHQPISARDPSPLEAGAKANEGTCP